MGYRDQYLQRIALAKARMDEALQTSTDAAQLLQTWQAICAELEQDVAPAEVDRTWLADRLHDLQTHVFNSARWQELLGQTESGHPARPSTSNARPAPRT